MHAQPKGILCVSVNGGQRPYKGIVRDALCGVLTVEFIAKQAPPLPLGKGFEVQMTGTSSGEDYVAVARVTARTDRPGVIQYGFQFLDPPRAALQLPVQFRANFNRKRRGRTWSKADRVSVTVLATEGARMGERVLGKLLELTSTGFSMLVGLPAEEVFADCPTVVCSYRPPGFEDQVRSPCNIASRSLEGKRIVYEMGFVETDAPSQEPDSHDFEPVWDCPDCGTRLLLGHSHRHCPECGRARGELSTYFPKWEDAKPTEEHWATGDDRVCVFCAAAFSDLAEFCGRCGKPLP